MPFPAEFYVTSNTLAVEHTALPTGVLAPDFSSNPKPWLHVSPASSETTSPSKKILILADPFFKQRDWAITPIRELLDAARRDGFQILIPNAENQLVAWEGDQEAIDHYEPDPKVWTRTHALEAAYQQHHLPANQVLVLDYFKLEQIINKKIIIDECNEKISQTDLWNYKTNEPTPLLQVYIDYWQAHDKKVMLMGRFNESQLQDPSDTSSWAMLIHYLQSQGIQAKFELNDPTALIHRFRDSALTESDKIVLQHLALLHVAFPDQLRLLAYTPHLEMVNQFKDKLELSLELLLMPNSLPELRVAYLNDLSLGYLVNLLKAAPHLEKITFPDSEGISEEINTITEVMSSIKDITVSKIDAAVLKKILTVIAPNCEVIFCREKKISGAFEGIKHKLALKNIDFSGSDLNNQDIQQLLALAVHVEVLDLGKCKSITGSVFSTLKPGSLPSLYAIDLEEIPITASDLRTLFAAAPALETIQCSGQALNGFFDQPVTVPLHLKKIIIKNSNFTSQEVDKLFTSIPTLEEIHFIGTGNDVKREYLKHFKRDHFRASLKKKQFNYFREFENFLPGSFPNLRKIVLNNTMLTGHQLEKLLLAAPNLEEIDLQMVNFSGEISDSLQTLKNLKIIKWHGTGNSADETIMRLCAAAPQLETLDITRQNLMDVTIPTEIFSKLQKLKINNSSLTGNTLKQIIERVGHSLKHISFQSCSLKPNNNIPTINNGLPNLESIDCSGSYFTSADINELRRVAPYAKIERSLVLGIPGGPSTGTREPVSLNSTTSETVPRTAEEDPNETLSYIPYFAGISPTQYRLYRCQVNLDKSELPTAAESRPIDFKPFELYQVQSIHQKAEGVKSVAPHEGVGIILPSLHFHEKLTALTVFNVITGEALPKDQVRIEHSDQEGFYRVILPKAGKYQINFTVTRPDEPGLPTPFLRNFQWKYRQYRPKPYMPAPDDNTLRSLARTLNRYQTGRCIQRSIAAYATLTEQAHPELRSQSMPRERVRVIINDVHAFLEIEEGGQWYKVDLGGYQCRLEELPVPKVTVKPKTTKAQATKTVEMPSHVSSIHTPRAVDPNAPLLVETPSSAATIYYYHELSEKYGQGNIFVATGIEEVSLEGIRVDRDGVVHPETLFKKWVNQSTDHTRMLVIDLKQFKQDEIPRLNDLLDYYVGGRKTPFEKIDLVLLDESGLHRYGSDFKRRVPEFKQLPLMHEKHAVITAPDDSTTTVTINLFHSPYWSQSLLGYFEVGETLSFKAGKLGKLLREQEATKKPYRICFQNPPMQDPAFLAFLESLQGLHEIMLAGERVPVPAHWSFVAKEVSFELQAGEVALKRLTELTPPPLVLSDGNLLSFIGEERYDFDEKGRLKSYPGYFNAHHQKAGVTPFRVIFSPALSEGSLQWFLDEAKKQGIPIEGYLQPTQSNLPSSLKEIPLPEEGAPWKKEKVTWHLAEDLYYTARALMQDHPEALAINLKALDPAECGWYPQKTTLPTPESPKFQVQAEYGAVAEALLQGRKVILYGEIRPALYDALLSLCQGAMAGQPYSGELIVVSNQTSASQRLASICVPESISAAAPTEHQQEALFKACYPTLTEHFLAASKQENFATYERKYLQQHATSPSPVMEEHDDEARSKCWDERRNKAVLEALTISPWVMLEGRTGIGKTHFLQHILGELVLPDLPKPRVFTNIEDWLAYSGRENEYAILACDEANASQLLDEARCTERFEGLLSGKKEIIWKGKSYPLSPHHKVIFAFNPDQYKAGRNSEGFLRDHAVTISFDVLPYYYVKARVIKPQLDDLLNTASEEAKSKIASSLSEIYGFFVRLAEKEGEQGEIRITPRELKCMINLTVSEMKRQGITDPDQCARLATEVAYLVGHQVLDEVPLLQRTFEERYAPLAGTPSLMQGMRGGATKAKAANDSPHTQTARLLLEGLLEARTTCLDKTHTDLGLGGFLLEGPSGVGKTHFVNEVLEDFKKRHPEETPKIRQIKTDLSYTEKIQQLKEAFSKGEIVLINEFNTTLWPVDLLNNFLMGRDEEGHPAKTPGFFLILTQNPASFEGREALDPATRRRLARVGAEDWPVHAHPSPFSFFSHSHSPTPPQSKPGTPKPSHFPGPGESEA